MVVLAIGGAITNKSPVFDQYAHDLMVSNAQMLAAAWHLEKRLIAADRVTAFQATPYPDGIKLSATFANRYDFEMKSDRLGLIWGFEDDPYHYGWLNEGLRVVKSHSVTMTDEIKEADLGVYRERPRAWLTATNRLTFRKARNVARAALGRIDLDAARMARDHTKEERQAVWQDLFTGGIIQTNLDISKARKDNPKGGDGYAGVVDLANGRFLVCLPGEKHNLPLPYYQFKWEGTHEGDFGVCEVDVSGLTGSVARLSLCLMQREFHAPPGYLGWFGLTTNTVFVEPVAGHGDGVYMLYEIHP